ncbi:hypothetical protein PCC6912_50800 [Chlorogloeopsis fritschii PCC 6912]|uniref:HTH luxR-type domain-containing protein n=1 Tax=Chlorogloeopsis fritschii PCC 6912 TaxID=211165 RepID=A0A433N1L4_CHLFR|nr:helix-turn-helix transcriptional regulator [Chlorogloeopsis fritschii]RUR74902.1 hypothetical protein PCC6912_50800 [Chlorogloeopsis fritschii PCC 6912]
MSNSSNFKVDPITKIMCDGCGKDMGYAIAPIPPICFCSQDCFLDSKRVCVSSKEWQVAYLVARGLSNDEIAETMGIGVKTVHTHVSSMLAKNNLKNRVQLALLFWSGNVITTKQQNQVQREIALQEKVR